MVRPSEEALSLRALARRISAIGKTKAQLKNQLYSLTATEETPDIVITQTITLIVSVKGIADASAVQLLGELLSLPAKLSI